MDELETSVDQGSQVEAPSGEPQVAPEVKEASGTTDGSQPETAKEENVPFHMHPRFQEVIAQKNEMQARMAEAELRYQKQLYEMQSQLQQFQSRLPKEQSVEDKMYQKLKGIDPEFADYLKGLEQKAAKFETYEQKLSQYDNWVQQREMADLQTQYDNKLNSLHSQYKTNDELKEFIQDKIDNAILKDNNIRLSDVERLYKEAHDKYSKFFTDYERKITSKYVTDKKKDHVPASQTGGNTPKSTGAPKSMTKDEAIAQIAKEMRAAKQAI